MRTGFTTLQQNIIDATVKKISWLVEIDQDNDAIVEYFWSTHAKTWGDVEYDPKIMELSPLSITLATPELGVIPPTKATLKVSFPDSQIDGLHASDFEGAAVTIRLIGEIAVGGPAELMAWRFVVAFAASTVQVLTLGLQDRFTKMLEGDYPNGPLVSELFPADIMKNDNACEPVPFGNPFYPARWIKKSLAATYVDADTFTVAGDQVALFSAGQFLLANCGADGQKGCWVDSSSYPISNCIKIARNGANNEPGIIQWLSGLEIGATYQVDLWAKKGEEATIHAYLGTAREFEAGISWTEMISFTWVATVTSLYLIVLVLTSTGTNSAYIDSVKVRKLTGGVLGSNLVTNGDFEAGITGWTLTNGGVLTHELGTGIPVNDYTTVNLTAASADLTVNLISVQTDHYYLGSSSHTYTIDRARTPREVNFKTTYLAADYTFKQDTIPGSDGNNYKVVQAIICDGNKDGVNDANGFWGVAEKLVYDMPLRVRDLPKNSLPIIVV